MNPNAEFADLRGIDDLTRGRIVAYVYGDERFEEAIRSVLRVLPRDVGSVVDVGCGIGWSTAELRRALPDSVVSGRDINVSSIEVADRLFGSEGVDFRAFGSRGFAKPVEQFDTAVVITTAPKLTALAAKEFGAELAGLVKPHGLAVLAIARGQTPSSNPPSSGPATDVPPVVEQLAVHLGGRLLALSHQENNTLLYAIALGAPSKADLDRAALGRPRLENRRRRAARTRLSLGVRVTPDGYMLPARRGPRVLVATPLRSAYSETFIRSHIEGLPAQVDVLFGSMPYAEDELGGKVIPRWARVLRFALTRLTARRIAGRLDAFWLDRFLTARRPAAVLAEYGPTGVSLMSACRRRSVPLVTQFLGFDASERAVVDGLRSEYATLLASGEAVAVSRDIKRRLIAMGAPSDHVHYIPCGVDTSRFSGATPSSNPPVFLAVGRFVEKKAPHLTILAFQRVLAEVPGARLRMVGDGPLLAACQQLAAALGLTGSVEFLGVRKHEELPALHREARAFIQHSMTAPSGDSEGTPVAILEAGASGLPIVATRHGGIPDSVVHGETGFLVDEGDIDGMAGMMIRLALDPELADRLGRRGRSHVTEWFQLDEGLARLWAVLEGAGSKELGG